MPTAVFFSATMMELLQYKTNLMKAKSDMTKANPNKKIVRGRIPN